MLFTGLCLPCWRIPVGCCVQATALAGLGWCGVGGWAVRRFKDLKTKEVVDDNALPKEKQVGRKSGGVL